MRGVGPGSVLGGRYAVRRRVGQLGPWERWTASDATLERQVVLLCFAADGAQASAAMDAARRAAGIEDSRLVRVLDVGTDEGLCFVVEEPLTDARTLAALLTDGGLPAEDARRIAGETASALEAARIRGLHHQVLTPAAVLLTEDGAVKVRGLATEAVLLAEDDVDAETASRRDALAVVALVYAGLTARWPLPGPESGLEAAPRVPGGIAAPSEIAVGVPEDLDRLCSGTLSEDRGPTTPREVANRLAPWAPQITLNPTLRPSGPVQTRPAPSRPPTTAAKTEPLARDRRTGGLLAAQAGTDAAEGEPGPARGGRAAQSPPAGAATCATSSEAPAGVPGPPRSGGFAVGGSAAGGPGTGASPDERRPGPPDPSATAPTPRSDHGPGTSAGDDDSPPGVSTPRAGRVLKAKLGLVAGAVGARAEGVGRRVGSVARATADKAAERAADRAERRRHEALSERLADHEDATLTEVLVETDDRMAPPVPLLAPETGELPDKRQSRLALAIVVFFVVVAAALGIWGLPQLTATPADTGDVAAPVATQTTAEASDDEAEPSPTPTEEVAPTAPVAIAGAAGFDPRESGGEVESSSAGEAYDGDPATAYRSGWYATADFGGYSVPGLGVVLTLEEGAEVSTVRLQLPAAQDVTVYVADGPSLDGATSLGSIAGANGTVEFTPPNDDPVTGQVVIVLVTKLGPDGDGRFRAQVAEVEILGRPADS